VMQGMDAATPTGYEGRGKRWNIHGNLATEMDDFYSVGSGSIRGSHIATSSSADDIRVHGNTFISTGATSNGDTLMTHFTGQKYWERPIFRDNVFANRDSASACDWIETAGADLDVGINNAYIEYIHSNNVMQGCLSTSYDTAEEGSTLGPNYFPATFADIQFTDAGSGNFEIMDGGTYSAVSSTGGKPGIDHSTLMALLADVESGETV
jgi:hypothetical protein